jgi:hypothetical protein
LRELPEIDIWFSVCPQTQKQVTCRLGHSNDRLVQTNKILCTSICRILATNITWPRATFIHLSHALQNESALSYYYVPRPPREHLCLLATRCYTPQPPDLYYQPPPQEYSYQAPPQQYVYQPPAQVYEYQPPPQQYVYQPPAEIYEYQYPPQRYVYQPPPLRCAPQPGDARFFWELGIPGRS